MPTKKFMQATCFTGLIVANLASSAMVKLGETDLLLEIADMTTGTATQTATTHERTHGTPNNIGSSSTITPLEMLISLEVAFRSLHHLSRQYMLEARCGSN